MSDVRRLNLMGETGMTIKQSSQDFYRLPPSVVDELERVLPDLARLPYWDPTYQAWLPFAQTYLRSGTNPSLAQRWLPILGSHGKVMGPQEGPLSATYAELLRMRRTSSTEVFGEYTWLELEEFRSFIELILNSAQDIRRILSDPRTVQQQLSALLECTDGDGLSQHFAYAVYLYRHCQFDLQENFLAERVQIEQQATVYCEKFTSAFRRVSQLCSSAQGVYTWYDQSVEQIITRAWLNSTTLDGSSYAIHRDEALAMSVKLSEELTNYLGDLPCVADLDVDNMFVFDAMYAALSPSATPTDHSSLYAYTLPLDRVTKLIKILRDFSDDVMSGEFFHDLLRRAEEHALQQGTNMDGFSSRYIAGMRSRGFPVKEE